MKTVKVVVATVLLVLCLTFIVKQCNAVDGFAPLNIAGDSLYFPLTGQVAVGVGSQVATFYNSMIEVRAEFVPAMNQQSYKGGLGVGLNVSSLVEKVTGKWVLKTINPVVGVMGLMDFNRKFNITPAVYLTILKVTL